MLGLLPLRLRIRMEVSVTKRKTAMATDKPIKREKSGSSRC